MSSSASTQLHSQRNHAQSSPADTWFLFTVQSAISSTLSFCIILYHSRFIYLNLFFSGLFCLYLTVTAAETGRKGGRERARHRAKGLGIEPVPHALQRWDKSAWNKMCVFFQFQAQFSDKWMLFLVVRSVVQPEMSAFPLLLSVFSTETIAILVATRCYQQ